MLRLKLTFHQLDARLHKDLSALHQATVHAERLLGGCAGLEIHSAPAPAAASIHAASCMALRSDSTAHDPRLWESLSA